MSIECITGVPSSGKTYFAAKLIKDTYDSKKRLIYTNVNLKVPYDDYLKILDIDKLFNFAKAEYELFERFEKLSTEYEKSHTQDDVISLKDDITSSNISDDTVLDDLDKENKFDKNDVSSYIGNYDKYLKDSKILEDIEGSLIVWDECHNRLQGDGVPPKANPIWVRFFSYHRHFDIDFILITQDISLIHRRYKPFISKFYFGQNPAKRFLTTTLKYKVYTDHREFEKFYIETINLPMKKEIFDFYDSGEYKPSKSVLLKKIVPALLLILVAVLFFYFYFDKGMESPSLKQKSIPINSSVTYESNTTYADENSHNSDYDDSTHFMFFTCNLDNCVLKNSSFSVPLDSFNDFAKSIGMTVLYTSKINRYYKQVAVSVPELLYNDLMRFNLNTRGDKHEKGRMDFTNTSSKF